MVIPPDSSLEKIHLVGTAIGWVVLSIPLGHMCGIDGSVKADYPLVYYSVDVEALDSAGLGAAFALLSPADWASYAPLMADFQTYFHTICVASCPTEADLLFGASPPRTATVSIGGVDQDLPAMSLADCPYDPEYCVGVPADTQDGK